MPNEAQYIPVATARTNTTPNSNVDVHIADMTLAWDIHDNLYGDKLPVIPIAARVEHGKVLYRLKIKITLRSLSRGGAVSGHIVNIASSRNSDRLRDSGATDVDGSTAVLLETREAGDLQLSVSDPSITAAPLRIRLKEAWYEAGFHITHYIIADERDASGPMVQAPGIEGQHRRDFLYGARGIPMQGTGETLDHRYIRFDGGGGGWHNNDAGHPDILNHPETARLHNTDGAHGRFGDVVADRSIAVDPTIIPGRARVYIGSRDGRRIVGDRRADDTGGGIRGAHIDHFSGAGSAATRQWEASGGDLQNAKVKYLGN